MKIAIITGGKTAERNVSIKSAKNIQKLIKFGVVKIFSLPQDEQLLEKELRNFDIAIPMIHGLGGEDGALEKIFKKFHIPFVFSNKKAHLDAIDKQKTKELVNKINIKSPSDTKNFPVFIKPRFGGSSIASKICSTKQELENLKKQYQDLEFITEQPISGREFTVGVVDYKNKTFYLPIIEIIPKNIFFDFESKYNTKKLAKEICPANISKKLYHKLGTTALKIHEFMGIKHISRSDFIIDKDNQIYFLEINTIPGMTKTSLIPRMLDIQKIDISDLFLYWCKKELKRY